MQPRPQRVRAGRHRRGWRHRAWSWPFENQLIQIEAPDDVVTTQTYAPATRNSDELRFSKETDTGITNFTWDNQNIIQEVDELNSVDAEYTLNPQPYGNLVSQRREAESTFYNYDALGSTESLTDESATKTDEYAYGAFGKILEQTGGTENPFGWVGELGYYREPDGRYDLRAREYEEAINRFLSEDPLKFDARDDNLYSYRANNPTNTVDPGGLGVQYHHWFAAIRPGGGEAAAKHICKGSLNIHDFTTPLDTGSGLPHSLLHGSGFTFAFGEIKALASAAGYVPVVTAINEYFSKRPAKTRCCEYLTAMTALITAAYQFAGGTGFPRLYAYNKPHRDTTTEFFALIATECGKSAAKKYLRRFKILGKCSGILTIILTASEVKGEIVDKTEQFEYEIGELINSQSTTSQEKAEILGNQIVAYEVEQLGLYSFNDVLFKNAVTVLKNGIQTKLYINKPINDVVLQFQKDLKAAAQDCSDPECKSR